MHAGTPPDAGQVWSQLLQCPGSPLMFVSQPFSELLSQSAYPLAQAAKWHFPATHEAVPCANAQPKPHLPQLVESLSVFTSQPSDVLPLQSAHPVLHPFMEQTPERHDALALGSEHAQPH